MLNPQLATFKLCEKSSYLNRGGSLYCTECKDHGVCKGGYITIYPEKGVTYLK